MSHPHQPPRVVLDTNLVLSSLVFGGGRPGALRQAWQRADFQPLISMPTATELLRTLSYPKSKLSGAEQGGTPGRLPPLVRDGGHPDAATRHTGVPRPLRLPALADSFSPLTVPATQFETLPGQP